MTKRVTPATTAIGVITVTLLVAGGTRLFSTTSGVFSGAATGRLHWSKRAELIEDAAEVAA